MLVIAVLANGAPQSTAHAGVCSATDPALLEGNQRIIQGRYLEAQILFSESLSSRGTYASGARYLRLPADGVRAGYGVFSLCRFGRLANCPPIYPPHHPALALDLPRHTDTPTSPQALAQSFVRLESKRKPQAKLNLSLVGSRVADPPEPSDSDRRRRLAEVGMVGKVKELGSEVEFSFFAEFERLE